MLMHLLQIRFEFLTIFGSFEGRQLRQVVMGKITAPDSFGEISVILQEAMVINFSEDALQFN